MSFVYNKNCVHAKDVLSSLHGLKQERKFCDVVLTVDVIEIYAHRVVLATTSTYFKALFDDNFREKDIFNIELHGINGQAAEILVNFIYTGEFVITNETVQTLLAASDMLQLPDAKEACCEFIRNNLTTENCLDIMMFSDKHFCSNLKTSAMRWGEEHFSEIVTKKHYLSLPAHYLHTFLSSDRLNALCESQIFECVVSWVEDRLAATSTSVIGSEVMEDVEMLLDCVRFPCLPVQYLIESVSANKVLLQSEKFQGLIDHTKTLHLMLNCCPGYKTEKKHLLPKQRIGCYTNVVYIMGGDENHQKLEMYDPSGLESQELADMPSCKIKPAVVKHGSYIYVIGGKNKNGLVLNTVLKFCTYNNTWTAGVKISECRSSAGGAALNGVLYVCGGFNGYITVSSLEMLTADAVSWKQLAHMNHRRFDFGLLPVNDRLFAVGGYDDCNGVAHTVETYDTVRNQWSIVSPMFTKKSSISCCVLENLIYVVSHNMVERYNSQTDTWAEISKQELLSLNSSTCAGIGEYLYIFGGIEKLSSVDKVYRYDVHADTWDEVPAMIYPRSRCSVINV